MTIATSQDSTEYQSHPRDTLLPVWKELSRETVFLALNELDLNVLEILVISMPKRIFELILA